MTRLLRTRTVKTVERILGEAVQRSAIFLRADSDNGPVCNVEGVELKNFGSCSYMAIEKHPRLMAGARDALERYGTQFAFSRAYLELPLYQDLERLLDQITGRHALVASTTTLGHLAALPVLVQDDDVVLIDQFAHSSCHMATELLKGTTVERLRHNRMDLLEERLIALGPSRRVWYVCDGVYSMLGDFADFDRLSGLLARYPNLHAYVDDAHAVSWTGRHGRGVALEKLGHCDRAIVALSMNKAFSAAGAVLALPSAALRTRIRRAGGPMLFSGPIQPPMLGAAVASAALHLSPEFAGMQAELSERILTAERGIEEHGLRVANRDRTPIFMVQFESPKSLYDALDAIKARGYYCCISTFPAVPMDKPSLRFTVSRHNSLAGIREFIADLAAIVHGGREVSALA